MSSLFKLHYYNETGQLICFIEVLKKLFFLSELKILLLVY